MSETNNQAGDQNCTVSTEDRRLVIKTTDGSIIKGIVNLNSDSAPMDRVSDLFIKGQNKFIVVVEATLEGKKDAVVIVNKEQIVWVMEDPNN